MYVSDYFLRFHVPLQNECYCGSCTEAMEYCKKQTPVGKTSGTCVSATSQRAGLAPRGIALFAIKPGAGQVITGADKMVSFKLKEGSTVIRYYTSCCGTLIVESPMKTLTFFPEFTLVEEDRQRAPTKRGFINVSEGQKKALEAAGVNMNEGEGIKILPSVCCGACIAVGPLQPPFWNVDPKSTNHKIVDAGTNMMNPVASTMDRSG